MCLLITIIIVLFFYCNGPNKELDDFDVCLVSNISDESDVYDVKIRVKIKDKFNLFKNNIIVSYSLNGDKYENLCDNSASVFVKDEKTSKVEQTYHFSDVTKNGANIDLIGDLVKPMYDKKCILELLFKVKPKHIKDNHISTLNNNDQIIVNIFPYNEFNFGKVQIESQKISIINQTFKRNQLNYYFPIPLFDSTLH